MRELIDEVQCDSNGYIRLKLKGELIRCGECIHRFVAGEVVRYNVCELSHNIAQPDDWFCADGERKDGAE